MTKGTYEALVRMNMPSEDCIHSVFPRKIFHSGAHYLPLQIMNVVRVVPGSMSYNDYPWSNGSVHTLQIFLYTRQFMIKISPQQWS